MLKAAHRSYAYERGRLVPGAEQDGGVGGAARGVKCLHAHYAHQLAGGPDPIGLWVAQRLAGGDPIHYERPGERLAAIDLGTNSIRLLVGRWADGALTELARDMVIVRLGQDVDTHERALTRRSVTRRIAARRGRNDESAASPRRQTDGGAAAHAYARARATALDRGERMALRPGRGAE